MRTARGRERNAQRRLSSCQLIGLPQSMRLNMIRQSKLIQSIVIFNDVGIPSVVSGVVSGVARVGGGATAGNGATAAAVTTISLFCLSSTFFPFDGFHRRADARRIFYTYANYPPPPPPWTKPHSENDTKWYDIWIHRFDRLNVMNITLVHFCCLFTQSAQMNEFDEHEFILLKCPTIVTIVEYEMDTIC